MPQMNQVNPKLMNQKLSEQTNSQMWMIFIGLVMAGVLSRLVPHAPNVTALTATALFAGAALKNRWAVVALPLVVLFLSDLFLGFHSLTLYVSAAMALVAWVASLSLRQSPRFPKWIGLAIGSSLFFFAVSNFGVWMQDSTYAPTWQGLLACYALAIPFLETQLVGDLAYTGVFFLVFEILRHWQPRWVQAES